MRQMLVRLRFTNQAAAEIVDNEGIDEMSEFETLTETQIESICKIVRRPGGAAAGILISAVAEENFKLGVFYVKHLRRCTRTVAYAGVTLANVRSIRQLRDYEKEHEDPTELPVIDHKDWPKTMENLTEYLHGFRGTTGVPLSYIMRTNETPPGTGTDPTFGAAGSKYNSIEEEMVARAPIRDGTAANNYVASFLQDRSRGWDLLFGVFKEDPAYTFMKTHKRARDGRGAAESLVAHYLGPNNVSNMANKAEKRLETLTYTGEKRRWNFEKYTRAHKEEHNILKGLIQHGYAGIDPRSEVRHLNNGIKTNTLDVPKSQIMASPTLRENFDDAVSVYKDYIDQLDLNASQDKRNISAVRTGGKSVNFAGESGKEVEDRYYTTKEYKALSQEQRMALKRKREARGHQPNKKSKWQNSMKEDVKALKSQISALTAKLQVENNESVDGYNNTSNDKDNTNNQALRRLGRKCVQVVSDLQFRRISTIISSRVIASTCHKDLEVKTEMDSHADTHVIGRQAWVTHDFNKPVTVSAYDPSLGSVKNKRIVSATLAYDNPETGETILLDANQAIEMPSIAHNLLSPMQMRVAGNVVDECPKFLHPNPIDTTHSITL